MKVDFARSNFLGERCRVIEITYSNTRDFPCVRGEGCTSKEESGETRRGVGALALYWVKMLSRFEYRSDATYSIPYCEGCLIDEIGWLRMEMVKVQMRLLES